MHGLHPMHENMHTSNTGRRLVDRFREHLRDKKNPSTKQSAVFPYKTTARKAIKPLDKNYYLPFEGGTRNLSMQSNYASVPFFNIIMLPPVA